MSTGTTTEAPAEVQAGQWIDGHQAIDRAPVEFIRGSRSRPLDGHLITGSWSDPWWLYCPVRGYAVVKRWKNKDTEVHDWTDGRVTVTPFPARNELVIEPWGARDGHPAAQA
jgi:hypothetical protein